MAVTEKNAERETASDNIGPIRKVRASHKIQSGAPRPTRWLRLFTAGAFFSVKDFRIYYIIKYTSFYGDITRNLLTKKVKKNKKKHKKNGLSYWHFLVRGIYSLSPSQHWVATQNKQKVLWQIREGNNWLNNFYMIFISTNKNIPASFSS